jgi:hypothetical protein
MLPPSSTKQPPAPMWSTVALALRIVLMLEHVEYQLR